MHAFPSKGSLAHAISLYFSNQRLGCCGPCQSHVLEMVIDNIKFESYLFNRLNGILHIMQLLLKRLLITCTTRKIRKTFY